MADLRRAELPLCGELGGHGGAVIRMPGAMAAKTIMAVSSRGGQSAAPTAGAETESLDINLFPKR